MGFILDGLDFIAEECNCRLLVFYGTFYVSFACTNFFNLFHFYVLPIQALKMVLEKESWAIMSAEASEIISLAGLTGDGAALISPTGSNSNLPINRYHGKSTMTDSGKPKNGFASWLQIENPFSSKLENGSANPQTPICFSTHQLVLIMAVEIIHPLIKRMKTFSLISLMKIVSCLAGYQNQKS
jgi:hypothetical protein